MEGTPPPTRPPHWKLPARYRLARMVVFEALLVALVGFLVWGIAWDVGYPTVGWVAAIIIWLTVSPVIEIATITRYRNKIDPDAVDESPGEKDREIER